MFILIFRTDTKLEFKKITTTGHIDELNNYSDQYFISTHRNHSKRRRSRELALE